MKMSYQIIITFTLRHQLGTLTVSVLKLTIVWLNHYEGLTEDYVKKWCDGYGQDSALQIEIALVVYKRIQDLG